MRVIKQTTVEHGSNHLSTSKLVDLWLTFIPKRWNDRVESWSRRLSDESQNAEVLIGQHFRLGDETLCLVASPGKDEPTKLAAFNSLLRLVRLILSVSSTLDIFRQEKFDRSALESFRGFMIKAVGWHLEDTLESKLKSYFADLLIRVAPLSERSSGVVRVFDGSLNRYMNLLALRARNGHLRSLTFIRSLLESKRLWYQLSEEKKKKAMQDHKDRLGKQLPDLSGEAKYWLRVATDLVFPPGVKYVPGSALPTRSAAITVTRFFGGAFEKYALDRKIQLGPNGRATLETNGMDPDISQRIRPFSEQSEMAFHLLGEKTGDYLIDPIVPNPRNSIRYDLKCGSGDSLFDIGKRMSRGGSHEVSYQAIPEPGKFRVITAGPESLYTAVRPFQQWMIERWKHFPLSTMSGSWVDRFRQSVTSNDGVFVSGDYEATTDLLHGGCASVILEQLFQNTEDIPIHMKKWVEWCMTPALINYPDGTQVQMKNGQLMGNPLSFVFLCIANLSTLMRTFEGSGIPADELDAFINGDDIYFKIPDETEEWPLEGGPMKLYHDWKSNAADLNLNLSLGKNLVSKKLAMINNVMITVEGEEVQYLRTALSLGHRVKSDAAVDAMTMPAIEDKLWLAVNPEASLELILNFRKRFKSKLMSVRVKGMRSFQPNWFFPKALGGYGLKNYTGTPIEASVQQRKVAGYLMRDPKEQFRFSYLSTRVDLPTSVKLALKSLKSTTAYEKSVHVGPLTWDEDLQAQLDSKLSRYLTSYRWIRDEAAPTKVFTLAIPKEIVTASYVPPMRAIMNYRSPHWRLKGVEESFPLLETEEPIAVNPQFNTISEEID